MKHLIASTGLAIILFTAACRADAIHDACQRNDLKQVKQLIAADPELANAMSRNGQTPLHIAVRDNRLAMVSFLLSKGADLNAKLEIPMYNDRGGTAILIAAANADLQMVKVLLEAKADPNIAAMTTSTTGVRTPLYCAASRLDLPMMQCLLAAKADVTMLSNGATALHGLMLGGVKAKTDDGMVRMLEPLIKAGVDLNAKAGTGECTALHLAAENGWIAVAKKLVAAGADLTIGDREGKTPADYAAAKGDTKMMNLLRTLAKKS